MEVVLAQQTALASAGQAVVLAREQRPYPGSDETNHFQLVLTHAAPVAQVAVLGGQIGAMSKQGLGSTFWFTVPLQLAEPPRPR